MIGATFVVLLIAPLALALASGPAGFLWLGAGALTWVVSVGLKLPAAGLLERGLRSA
ncbi:MAG: hypothetical protein ACRD2T_14320 [Thermoanaerobaculia bacterium]